MDDWAMVAWVLGGTAVVGLIAIFAALEAIIFPVAVALDAIGKMRQGRGDD